MAQAVVNRHPEKLNPTDSASSQARTGYPKPTMNSDHTPTTPAAGNRELPVIDQVRSYRDLRLRRRRDKQARSKHRRQLSEHDIIIGFAQKWLPFGGAPDDEIFQHFGMDRQRYIDLLWATVHENRCEPDLAEHLAGTYPPNARPCSYHGSLRSHGADHSPAGGINPEAPHVPQQAP